MKKTINTAVAALKVNIANSINGSGLPACIIEEVMTNFVNQAHALAAVQLQQDVEAEEPAEEKSPKKEKKKDGEEKG